LDELLAERERAQLPPTPPPALTVDPVAVPAAVDTRRRAVRQRLAELEHAARRNYRSAEEARRVLVDEHQRLEQELSARTLAQQEAAALRRELERLTTEETRRQAQEHASAQRAARAEIADELKHFQDEHERALHEVAILQGSLSEHDGLLDEYVTRLRDEQGARADLRAELDRAEAARSLAERSLQRATENARHGAEDEMIRLATAEQELADTRSDRDRLAAKLAELTAGDGAIGRLTAELDNKTSEIGQLGVRIADLSARIDASEDAAHAARAERDAAVAQRCDLQARRQESERARLDAEQAVVDATAQIGALEAALAEHIETADARTRELDLTLGKLRREAREAGNARSAAEAALAAAVAERDDLRTRVADAEAQSVRARADGDRLRAHAAALGDELAAVRATVAVLQTAAPAPVNADAPPVAPQPEELQSDQSPVPEDQSQSDTPPPLPLRIAGRHAPAPPPARRRPRREPATAAGAPVAPPAAASAAVALAAPEPRVAPAFVPALEPDAAAPEATPAPVVAEGADGTAEASAPAPEQTAPTETFRRTALAEFTALATSSGDDFTFRRH
jgi:chromosome segregation ATPase